MQIGGSGVEILEESESHLVIRDRVALMVLIILLALETIFLIAALFVILGANTVIGITSIALAIALMPITIRFLRPVYYDFNKGTNRLERNGFLRCCQVRKAIGLNEIQEVRCKIYLGDVRVRPTLKLVLSSGNSIVLSTGVCPIIAPIIEVQSLPCKLHHLIQQFGIKMALFLDVAFCVIQENASYIPYSKPGKESRFSPQELRGMASYWHRLL